MEPINQYPDGTTLLWKAHYRRDQNNGNLDDCITLKFCGTTVEAATVAQEYAEKHNYILQCLSRRY